MIIKYSMHYEYVLVKKTFDNFMYQFLPTEYIVFSKKKFRGVFKTKNGRKVFTKVSRALS